MNALPLSSVRLVITAALGWAVLIGMAALLGATPSVAADPTKKDAEAEKPGDDNPYSKEGDFAAGDEKKPEGNPAAKPSESPSVAKPVAEVDPRDLERNIIERRFAVPDLLDPAPIFDWENHHVLHRNRKPSHCTGMVYADEKSALEATRSAAKALHYTTEQLDDAWRLDELRPIPQIVLSLDHAQQGLGNGSCGTAITMDEYQLKRKGAYEFTFTLQGAK